MARFKVTHSEDACCIEIRGDKRSPEPSTAVIKFPGGHIEVSRCTDGTYWVHMARNVEHGDPDQDADVLGVIVDSRIDYTLDAYRRNGGRIDPMPAASDIRHLAVRIAREESGAISVPIARSDDLFAEVTT